MSQIDWSKAPEWANIHGYVSNIAIPVWVGNDQYCYVDGRQYGRVFSFYGCEGWAREQIQGITTRPVDALKAESAPAWVGIGLPPVGTVCEAMKRLSDTWLKVRIIDHQGTVETAACRVIGDDSLFWAQDFRPIRTPEQIAADERLHEIRNALTAIKAGQQQFPNDLVRGNIVAATVEAMIDAGYRKQEADK
jgi:hypothetical protein